MNQGERPAPDWQKMVLAASLSGQLADRDKAWRDQTRSLLRGFLEVLDSFDRILGGADAETKRKLDGLHRQLLGAFERAGVRFLPSLDRPFDPQRQEAVDTNGDSALESGTVVVELRRGCEWQGELLRAAQVVVAKSQEQQGESDHDSDRH